VGTATSRDLPARAAGPARAVEINLACHQGHVATVEQRGRGHLAGVDRAAAAERDQRIGADPLGLGHKGPHRTCGHMLPDAREHAGAVRGFHAQTLEVFDTPVCARRHRFQPLSTPSWLTFPKRMHGEGPPMAREPRTPVIKARQYSRKWVFWGKIGAEA
jgi:hypothetical protein